MREEKKYTELLLPQMSLLRCDRKFFFKILAFCEGNLVLRKGFATSKASLMHMFPIRDRVLIRDRIPYRAKVLRGFRTP